MIKVAMSIVTHDCCERVSNMKHQLGEEEEWREYYYQM